MTTRYVGPGGLDVNSGLTWALRKLTLNGVEDSPVAAGDIIYVGAGIYRETLTCDVDGTSGNEIEYVGDVTGEYTDGIGGIIRLTGLDSDTGTPQRNNLIDSNGYDYRKVRGFCFDGWDSGSARGAFAAIFGNLGSADWTIERCVFDTSYWSTAWGWSSIVVGDIDNNMSNWVVSQCVMMPGSSVAISQDALGSGTWGITFEHCYVFCGSRFQNESWSGTIIRHCMQFLTERAPYANSPMSVYDSVINWTTYGMTEGGGDYLTEDYNILNNENAGIKEGANTVDGALHPKFPLLYNGIRFPFNALEIQAYPASNVRMATTSGETFDLFNLDRSPSGKQTRGPVTLKEVARDTGTVRSGTSSIELPDATRHVFTIPIVGGALYTLNIEVYWEADYAGTKPQVAIKRTQYAEQEITAVGGSESWERLTYTFRADADEELLRIELRSNNTAASGNYQVYFDNWKFKSSKDKNISVSWFNKYNPIGRLLNRGSEDGWFYNTLPVSPGFPTREGPIPPFYRPL